jgi:hypothetical protein
VRGRDTLLTASTSAIGRYKSHTFTVKSIAEQRQSIRSQVSNPKLGAQLPKLPKLSKLSIFSCADAGKKQSYCTYRTVAAGEGESGQVGKWAGRRSWQDLGWRWKLRYSTASRLESDYAYAAEPLWLRDTLTVHMAIPTQTNERREKQMGDSSAPGTDK